jgi:hypothetical protein
MILRKSGIKITSKNNTCAINEDIKFGLVLFFSFSLIESGLPGRLSFLQVIQINELVFNSFYQVLKMKRKV